MAKTITATTTAVAVAAAVGSEAATQEEQLSSATIPKDELKKHFPRLANFLNGLRGSGNVLAPYPSKDLCSLLTRGLLAVQRIERGRITCLLTVKPCVSNIYGGLHGAAVAVVSEAVSTACARTIVAEDRSLFLGDLSLSYLSAAPLDAEVIVDACVLKSGRSVTVTSVEYKLKKTGRLAYLARANFYNMPAAKL